MGDQRAPLQRLHYQVPLEHLNHAAELAVELGWEQFELSFASCIFWLLRAEDALQLLLTPETVLSTLILLQILHFLM